MNYIQNIGIEEQLNLWKGCINYYKFDETSGSIANDSIANSNGTTAYATWASGKQNNCIRLNSASYPYVSFTKHSFEYNQTWSLSLWIKREAVSFYYCWIYVDSKQASPYAGWRLGFNNVNKLMAQIQNTATYLILQHSDSTLSDTTNWHHVVFTYNGNGYASGCKFYLDGVESTWTVTNDNLQSKSLASAATYEYIGQVDSLIAYNPQAYFDEYAIWNRVLSETEVKLLYSAGNGKFYGTLPVVQNPLQITGLRAWYGDYVNGGTLRTTLSNGASITSWDDLSGNAFNLNNVSGTTTYDSTKKGIYLNSGCLYNTSHNIITGSTSRTIFNVVESTDTSTLADTFHLGLYDGSNHEWGEIMRNGDYTIASNSGYARYNTTNSNNVKYIWTTQLNGTSIYNNATTMKNNNTIARSSGVNATMSNYVGIIVGGYFGTGVYTPVKRGAGLTVSEIIIYDRILSQTEIKQILLYLNNKYSVY